MNKNKALRLTQAAVTAALYVLLSALSQSVGFCNGIVQCRLSEVLTVLPALFPATVSGLAIGCFLTNLLTGSAIWDILFGTLATLIGALGTMFIGRLFSDRKRLLPILAAVPPILANTAVIPPMLVYLCGAEALLPFLFFSIFAGEFISCGILGFLLLRILIRRNDIRS